MFQGRHGEGRPETCFPRIRGDVPTSYLAEPPENQFSPHTRGCSCIAAPGLWDLDVFPAYAGMFLDPEAFTEPDYGFPRIRGDVPLEASQIRGSGFSPHTRGCSAVLFSSASLT